MFEKANFAASCSKDGKATKFVKVVEKAIECAQDAGDEYEAELKMLDR